MTIALVAASLGLSACQHLPRTPSQWSEPRGSARNRSHSALSGSEAISIPTPAELAYEQSADGLRPHQRFEFSRRDYLLSRRVAAPILATNQWPIPFANRERRVRFYYWQQ